MIPQQIHPKYLWLLGAGLCGSALGLGLNIQACNTPMKKAIYVFGGITCSFFLAGPIANYFGLKDPGEVASVGFAVSIFWQQIISKVSLSIDGLHIPFIGGNKNGNP